MGWQLRQVYQEIADRFGLKDGVSRRIAALASQAWLNYEALGREIESYSPRTTDRKRVAASLARLRRRQSGYASAYLGGLRTLAALTGAGAGKELDLARLLSDAQREVAAND